METYIKTNINLLTRLSREANEVGISSKKYTIFARGISTTLDLIDKYHGIIYLYYIVYHTLLILEGELGPLNAKSKDKLIKLGFIVTKTVYVKY
jgi:hypothetical protein